MNVKNQKSLGKYLLLFALFNFIFFQNCSKKENFESFSIRNIFIGVQSILSLNTLADVQLDQSIVCTFSSPLDITTVSANVLITKNGQNVPLNISFFDQNQTISIAPNTFWDARSTYVLTIKNQLKDNNKNSFQGYSFSFSTVNGEIKVQRILYGNKEIGSFGQIFDLNIQDSIFLEFSAPVNRISLNAALTFSPLSFQDLILTLSSNDQKLIIKPKQNFDHLKKYTLSINTSLKGKNNENFNGVSQDFITVIDTARKFPVISTDELITKVQKETFKYFWDYAHPQSGMIRERINSDNLVTTGGSGFGIMAIIVGIEKNFITRTEGIERVDKMVNFLEKADRFHGVWPHWINGVTGKTIPFSTNDNGADLVETALMMQGLLTFRQYLSDKAPMNTILINRITKLWEEVEWTWFIQGNNERLLWHWSPDKGFLINLPIAGWNESLIVYVLAASSPTFPITKTLYDNAWARKGQMVNNKSFFGIKLPLGYDFGGPLFFAHYSFLGLDPRKLSDKYANYWEQNTNHSLINWEYCKANPKKYLGYSASCWGLTASDNHKGYSAHSPTNDLGVISPTAALSSMPYTPDASIKAMEFFYYTLGDKIWKEYGFVDAFNLSETWFASSHLAIDQGPIIIMMENYKSGLLWQHFMKDKDIMQGLKKLEFNF